MRKYAAAGLAVGLAATPSQSATEAASGSFGSIQVVCRSSHTNSDDRRHVVSQ